MAWLAWLSSHGDKTMSSGWDLIRTLTSKAIEWAPSVRLGICFEAHQATRPRHVARENIVALSTKDDIDIGQRKIVALGASVGTGTNQNQPV